MLFSHSPYRKQIAIISGLIVIVGAFILYRNRDVYPHYASMDSMAVEAPSALWGGEMQKEESFLGATGNIGTSESRAMQPMRIPSPDYGNGSVAVDVPAEERLIVKNGSLSLLVDDVATAVNKVQAFAFGNGGFVVSSNVDKSGSTPYGYVTVRIPSDIFDTGLDAVRELGEVQSEHVDAQDVTEEYVDLGARLKNLQASESQLLELMTRATKIEDILAVQRELTSVRGQIESLEGRMKYLTESASFSLLTVHLSNDPENLPILDQGDTWKPIATVKNAIRDLLDVGTGIVDGIIWILIFVPVWIVVGLVLWLVTRIYKKHQQ